MCHFRDITWYNPLINRHPWSIKAWSYPKYSSSVFPLIWLAMAIYFSGGLGMPHSTKDFLSIFWAEQKVDRCRLTSWKTWGETWAIIGSEIPARIFCESGMGNGWEVTLGYSERLAANLVMSSLEMRGKRLLQCSHLLAGPPSSKAPNCPLGG